MSFKETNLVGRFSPPMVFAKPLRQETNNLSIINYDADETQYSGVSYKKHVIAAVFATGIAISAAPLSSSVPNIVDNIKSSSSRTLPAKTSNSTPTNSADVFIRTQIYRKLRETIEGLSSLDEDDPRFVDSETVSSGVEFLTFIQEFNVPPPRIFPHGGDALIFEWEGHDAIRYVTYDEFVARLKDQGSNAEYKDAVNLDLRQGFEASQLIRALGGQQWRVKQSNSII